MTFGNYIAFATDIRDPAIDPHSASPRRIASPIRPPTVAMADDGRRELARQDLAMGRVERRDGGWGVVEGPRVPGHCWRAARGLPLAHFQRQARGCGHRFGRRAPSRRMKALASESIASPIRPRAVAATGNAAGCRNSRGDHACESANHALGPSGHSCPTPPCSPASSGGAAGGARLGGVVGGRRGIWKRGTIAGGTSATRCRGLYASAPGARAWSVTASRRRFAPPIRPPAFAATDNALTMELQLT